MKLVTASTEKGDQAAAILGDWILPLSCIDGSNHRSVGDVIRAGEDNLAKISDAVSAAGEALDNHRDRGELIAYGYAVLKAPFPNPGLVFSTGGNYRSHLAEVEAKLGIKIGEPKEPVGFIKNNNAIIGSGANIILPPHAPDEVDWEAEFSFVIGRSCHAIREEEVEDRIIGYTMINDVSQRGWNKDANRPDGSIDFTLPTFAKQFPTFCPMGPCFVTKDEIPDPYDVNFSTRVNGNLMQDGNTSDMIFNMAQIISYFSTWFSFEPGDVVSTGSPAGVGFARTPAVFLQDGDEVSITADVLGTLTNRVVKG
ncbi:MAG: fumarylacetoacetate hydrolase family protein [Proteobacteria bacterium]|nr:fumarylacetoacetate hydrolase family protein [Pseudomonadota bacterium]